MTNILKKEMRLAASPLSYFFILFGLMFFLPGYPVLCGPFFVTLGLFQSFQSTRETNDIAFSLLLPIAKGDVVKGKYLFVCFIELCSILIMAVVMLLRMTILSDVPAYRENALMTANPFALGMVFVIFGFFNLIFVGGFFKTVYKLAKPFVLHIIITFVIIFAAEAAHYIPGLQKLNSFGFENWGIQFGLLAIGVILYIGLTGIALKKACRNFENLDL